MAIDPIDTWYEYLVFAGNEFLCRIFHDAPLRTYNRRYRSFILALSGAIWCYLALSLHSVLFLYKLRIHLFRVLLFMQSRLLITWKNFFVRNEKKAFPASVKWRCPSQIGYSTLSTQRSIQISTTFQNSILKQKTFFSKHSETIDDKHKRKDFVSCR